MSDHSDDPAAIERDLNATRARLDSRLHELSQRLSPGQMVDEALHYLRSSQGADFARNLSETVRERPVPVLLAGIGLAWLMIAGPRPPQRVVYVNRGPDTASEINEKLRRAWEAGKSVTRTEGESDTDFRARVAEARGKALGLTRQAQETMESFMDRIQEALYSARDSLAETADNAAGWANETAQHARETVQRAGDAASDLTDRMARSSRRLGEAMKQGYGRTVDAASRGSNMIATLTDNPLLLGSLGLLTGAALGALFPATDTERHLLNQPVSKVGETIRQTAQDVTDRGYHAARQAVNA